jgi:hypothetical protein
VYDEEASAAENMDIVRPVEDSRTTVAQWIEAMRRLNGINDPLARRLLALHRDCGSGTGVCDSDDDGPVPMDERYDWGCETTSLIATHFGVDYPAASTSG